MTLRIAASRICINAGIFLLAASTAPLAHAEQATTQIEQQRELFRKVFASVERGDWTAVDKLSQMNRQLLEQYVLWPDLRATWLRANIDSASATEIDRFVERYGTLKPARELRYRYALNFVRNDDLAAYLKIYEQYYQGLDIEKLDCLALQAEIKAGRHRRVEIRALDLWLVGESQVSEHSHLIQRGIDTLVGHFPASAFEQRTTGTKLRTNHRD